MRTIVKFLFMSLSLILFACTIAFSYPHDKPTSPQIPIFQAVQSASRDILEFTTSTNYVPKIIILEDGETGLRLMQSLMGRI